MLRNSNNYAVNNGIESVFKCLDSLDSHIIQNNKSNIYYKVEIYNINKVYKNEDTNKYFVRNYLDYCLNIKYCTIWSLEKVCYTNNDNIIYNYKCGNLFRIKNVVLNRYLAINNKNHNINNKTKNYNNLILLDIENLQMHDYEQTIFSIYSYDNSIYIKNNSRLILTGKIINNNTDNIQSFACNNSKLKINKNINKEINSSDKENSLFFPFGLSYNKINNKYRYKYYNNNILIESNNEFIFEINYLNILKFYSLNSIYNYINEFNYLINEFFNIHTKYNIEYRVLLNTLVNYVAFFKRYLLNSDTSYYDSNFSTNIVVSDRQYILVNFNILLCINKVFVLIFKLYKLTIKQHSGNVNHFINFSTIKKSFSIIKSTNNSNYNNNNNLNLKIDTSYLKNIYNTLLDLLLLIIESNNYVANLFVNLDKLLIIINTYNNLFEDTTLLLNFIFKLSEYCINFQLIIVDNTLRNSHDMNLFNIKNKSYTIISKDFDLKEDNKNNKNNNYINYIQNYLEQSCSLNNKESKNTLIDVISCNSNINKSLNNMQSENRQKSEKDKYSLDNINIEDIIDLIFKSDIYYYFYNKLLKFKVLDLTNSSLKSYIFKILKKKYRNIINNQVENIISNINNVSNINNLETFFNKILNLNLYHLLDYENTFFSKTLEFNAAPKVLLLDEDENKKPNKVNKNKEKLIKNLSNNIINNKYQNKIHKKHNLLEFNNKCNLIFNDNIYNNSKKPNFNNLNKKILNLSNFKSNIVMLFGSDVKIEDFNKINNINIIDDYIQELIRKLFNFYFYDNQVRIDLKNRSYLNKNNFDSNNITNKTNQTDDVSFNSINLSKLDTITKRTNNNNISTFRNKDLNINAVKSYLKSYNNSNLYFNNNYKKARLTNRTIKDSKLYNYSSYQLNLLLYYYLFCVVQYLRGTLFVYDIFKNYSINFLQEESIENLYNNYWLVFNCIKDDLICIVYFLENPLNTVILKLIDLIRNKSFSQLCMLNAFNELKDFSKIYATNYSKNNTIGLKTYSKNQELISIIIKYIFKLCFYNDKFIDLFEFIKSCISIKNLCIANNECFNSNKKMIKICNNLNKKALLKFNKNALNNKIFSNKFSSKMFVKENIYSIIKDIYLKKQSAVENIKILSTISTPKLIYYYESLLNIVKNLDLYYSNKIINYNLNNYLSCFIFVDSINNLNEYYSCIIILNKLTILTNTLLNDIYYKIRLNAKINNNNCIKEFSDIYIEYDKKLKLIILHIKEILKLLENIFDNKKNQSFKIEENQTNFLNKLDLFELIKSLQLIFINYFNLNNNSKLLLPLINIIIKVNNLFKKCYNNFDIQIKNNTIIFLEVLDKSLNIVHLYLYRRNKELKLKVKKPVLCKRKSKKASSVFIKTFSNNLTNKISIDNSFKKQTFINKKNKYIYIENNDSEFNSVKSINNENCNLINNQVKLCNNYINNRVLNINNEDEFKPVKNDNYLNIDDIVEDYKSNLDINGNIQEKSILDNSHNLIIKENSKKSCNKSKNSNLSISSKSINLLNNELNLFSNEKKIQNQINNKNTKFKRQNNKRINSINKINTNKDCKINNNTKKKSKMFKNTNAYKNLSYNKLVYNVSNELIYILNNGDILNNLNNNNSNTSYDVISNIEEKYECSSISKFNAINKDKERKYNNQLKFNYIFNIIKKFQIIYKFYSKVEKISYHIFYIHFASEILKSIFETKSIDLENYDKIYNVLLDNKFYKQSMVLESITTIKSACSFFLLKEFLSKFEISSINDILNYENKLQVYDFKLNIKLISINILTIYCVYVNERIRTNIYNSKYNNKNVYNDVSNEDLLNKTINLLNININTNNLMKLDIIEVNKILNNNNKLNTNDKRGKNNFIFDKNLIIHQQKQEKMIKYDTYNRLNYLILLNKDNKKTKTKNDLSLNADYYNEINCETEEFINNNNNFKYYEISNNLMNFLAFNKHDINSSVIYNDFIFEYILIQSILLFVEKQNFIESNIITDVNINKEIKLYYSSNVSDMILLDKIIYCIKIKDYIENFFFKSNKHVNNYNKYVNLYSKLISTIKSNNKKNTQTINKEKKYANNVTNAIHNIIVNENILDNNREILIFELKSLLNNNLKKINDEDIYMKIIYDKFIKSNLYPQLNCLLYDKTYNFEMNNNNNYVDNNILFNIHQNTNYKNNEKVNNSFNNVSNCKFFKYFDYIRYKNIYYDFDKCTFNKDKINHYNYKNNNNNYNAILSILNEDYILKKSKECCSIINTEDYDFSLLNNSIFNNQISSFNENFFYLNYNFCTKEYFVYCVFQLIKYNLNKLSYNINNLSNHNKSKTEKIIGLNKFNINYKNTNNSNYINNTYSYYISIFKDISKFFSSLKNKNFFINNSSLLNLSTNFYYNMFDINNINKGNICNDFKLVSNTGSNYYELKDNMFFDLIEIIKNSFSFIINNQFLINKLNDLENVNNFIMSIDFIYKEIHKKLDKIIDFLNSSNSLKKASLLIIKLKSLSSLINFLNLSASISKLEITPVEFINKYNSLIIPKIIKIIYILLEINTIESIETIQNLINFIDVYASLSNINNYYNLINSEIMNLLKKFISDISYLDIICNNANKKNLEYKIKLFVNIEVKLINVFTNLLNLLLGNKNKNNNCLYKNEIFEKIKIFLNENVCFLIKKLVINFNLFNQFINTNHDKTPLKNKNLIYPVELHLINCNADIKDLINNIEITNKNKINKENLDNFIKSQKNIVYIPFEIIIIYYSLYKFCELILKIPDISFFIDYKINCSNDSYKKYKTKKYKNLKKYLLIVKQYILTIFELILLIPNIVKYFFKLFSRSNENSSNISKFKQQIIITKSIYNNLLILLDIQKLDLRSIIYLSETTNHSSEYIIKKSKSNHTFRINTNLKSRIVKTKNFYFINLEETINFLNSIADSCEVEYKNCLFKIYFPILSYSKILNNKLFINNIIKEKHLTSGNYVYSVFSIFDKIKNTLVQNYIIKSYLQFPLFKFFNNNISILLQINILVKFIIIVIIYLSYFELDSSNKKIQDLEVQDIYKNCYINIFHKFYSINKNNTTNEIDRRIECPILFYQNSAYMTRLTTTLLFSLEIILFLLIIISFTFYVFKKLIFQIKLSYINSNLIKNKEIKKNITDDLITNNSNIVNNEKNCRLFEIILKSILVIIIKKQTLYYLFNILFFIIGFFVHPFFLTIFMIDVAFQFKTVKEILIIMFQVFKKFVYIVVLLLIIHYFVLIINFNIFNKYYVSNNTNSTSLDINNLIKRNNTIYLANNFIKNIDKSLTYTGGIGGYFNKNSYLISANYYANKSINLSTQSNNEIDALTYRNHYLSLQVIKNIVYDFILYFILSIVFSRFTLSIIKYNITYFREIKNKSIKLEDTKCLICNLNIEEIEKIYQLDQDKAWNIHIHKHHNIWSYVRYILYLSTINQNCISEIENYVYNMHLSSNYSFFPNKEVFKFHTNN